MIACVAAGTGFAVVPRSVLSDLRSSKGIRQHDLPKQYALSRTHLVWNGEVSPALNGLISLFVDTREKPNLRRHGARFENASI